MITSCIRARARASVFGHSRIALKVSLLLCSLALPAGLLTTSSTAAGSPTSSVTVSSLGTEVPTFTGPAATGCASGCALLAGPTLVPSTASFALGSSAAQRAWVNIKGADNAAARLSPGGIARLQAAAAAYLSATARMSVTGRSITNSARAAAAAAAAFPGGPRLSPHAQFVPPQGAGKPSSAGALSTISCTSGGAGCNPISLLASATMGVKGIDAVDSSTMPINTNGDTEPSDQGLCAGKGYVVESNNIGEVRLFDTRLQRVSGVIPLDTMMGLTAKGWSSGGDVSCNFDYAHGGHWFFTEIVSASSEASGGPFAGCFAGVAHTCYEAIAVTTGDSPYGPYNVYFLDANYNPAEPGAPNLLNDFAKTAVSRDAFLVFYDEFPLVEPGIGGGYFNGAQEFAFDKAAMENGRSVTLADGAPNPDFNVAIENMGALPTPDGTCVSDDTYQLPGFTCWYSVIPAMPPDPTQFDNSNGGSAFMLDTLDFYNTGDSRLAVFAWTELSALDSTSCEGCGAIRFGGQLLSGVEPYLNPGFSAPQKAGPIPLGDECGALGLARDASCPEGGIATNGDNFTQASQAQGKLWGAISTQVIESFGTSSETHLGAADYVVSTAGFDHGGLFSLAGQGYIAPTHEDLSMPDLIAPDYGAAALVFTLTGNGGPTGADDGGFYPSTAYVNVLVGKGRLSSGTIDVVDLGQAPQDGFTEYLGYPYTRERWGDYSQGVFDPQTGEIYFANEYIQFASCTGAAFTAGLGICGGTRDTFANWGTSVNAVTP